MLIFTRFLFLLDSNCYYGTAIKLIKSCYTLKSYSLNLQEEVWCDATNDISPANQMYAPSI